MGYRILRARLKHVVLGLALACSCVRLASAAGNDNDVEWYGVHSSSRYRSPERPRAGQSFRVGVRVFRGDLTAARVRVWDGSEKFFSMSWVRQDGPDYEIWEANLSGLSGDVAYYYFELSDGTDRDYYNTLGMWDSRPSRGDFRVDLTPLSVYPLGASLATSVRGVELPTQGTVFRVWAPNAETASVAGEFNGWRSDQNPMTNFGGVWEVHVPAARAGHEYKFVFDGDIWRTDPRTRLQTNSVGNSVITDRASYEWGDENWVTPFFEDMVIYELHVGSFSGQDDGVASSPAEFRHAVDVHLEHLVDLGINMVELLPVNEFSGERSWGYNPSFLYAIEEVYGGPEQLAYLVDKLHQNGIGVLIDVVYNHMGGSDLSGNLLEYDGEEIYFYAEGNGYRDTPWGPRLDYGRREVREYILDNLLFWLEEFHFDGFRLDATAFMNINAEGWQLLKDIGRVVDTVSSKAIVIAEHLPNDPAVTQSIESGGAGLDAQWNDALHDHLRDAIRAAAFGDPSMANIADGLNHFALGSGTQVVNYIESHDEAAHQGRIPVEADGANPGSIWAQGRSKLALALATLSAGIPLILQGQEFLEPRKFGDAPENRIQWKLVEEHAEFLEFCKTLLWLRREQPALRSSAFQNVYHVNDNDNVLAFQRWTDAGDDLVVVVSFANEDIDAYELGFPQAGTWFEIVNGDSRFFGGRNHGNGGEVVANGASRHGMAQSARLLIPRMGVLVFAREPWQRKIDEPSGFLRGDCSHDGALDLSDSVSILTQLFLGGEPSDCESACDTNGDEVLDLSDAVYGLNFLFIGGSPPPSPWPSCGIDSDATLGCDRGC